MARQPLKSLTESMFYVLLALWRQERCGTEIAAYVRQLTEDHTVVANEVRLGNLTKEQADHSSIQNVLTRCVGVQEEVYPDLFFGEVQRDAVYMLCSDGFRHRITEDEMQKYLRRPAEGSLQMKRQEEYLIELNKQRGETDNISVITIHTER